MGMQRFVCSVLGHFFGSNKWLQANVVLNWICKPFQKFLIYIKHFPAFQKKKLAGLYQIRFWEF